MQIFECLGEQHVDSSEVLAALETDGVCVLRNFLSIAEVEHLRDEALALASLRESWLVHNQASPGLISFSPLVARKQLQEGRLTNLTAVFANPLFKWICQSYLGGGWYIDRILLDRKETGPEPLTGWHADQFAHRGKCVKFMLYLNDTGPANGAFSYVPGSHRLINHLMAQLSRQEIDNRAAHTYEDILASLQKVLKKEKTWPDTIGTIIDEAKRHIRSSNVSDDHYSIAAPAGSVVVFDANGIHRGGIVAQGERFIVRSHCRKFDAMTVLSSKAALGTFMQRLYYRWTAPAGLAGLV